MNNDEIKKLSDLAAIEVSEEETHSFSQDIHEILEFLNQISEVDTSSCEPQHRASNVVRKDENPFEKGVFTDDILDRTPQKQDGFIKVNKIL